MSFNLWQYKPWWCQPWSIILTGIVGALLSWYILRNIWITAGLSGLILAWWGYFLVYYPRLIGKLVQQGTIKLENIYPSDSNS